MQRWNYGLTKVFHYLGRNTRFKFSWCIKINLVCTPRRSHIWGFKLIHFVSFRKCLQKMKFRSLWKLQAEESGVKLLLLKMSSNSQVKLRKMSQKPGSVGVTFLEGLCIGQKQTETHQSLLVQTKQDWKWIAFEPSTHACVTVRVAESLWPYGLRVGVKSKEGPAWETTAMPRVGLQRRGEDPGMVWWLWKL